MTNLEINEIKRKGVLYARENGCELYIIIGKWNKSEKKPNIHWYMISEKTGVHLVTSQSNRMDERVKSHWEGFKINQSKEPTLDFSKYVGEYSTEEIKDVINNMNNDLDNAFK